MTRIVQFTAGRIEISIPYQLAIAVFLGVVLLALVVFRLGQIAYPQKTTDTPEKMPETVQTTKMPDIAGKIPPSAEKLEPANLKANNRIVITQYHTARDLGPVRDYFALFGIETEIITMDNTYFLVLTDWGIWGIVLAGILKGDFDPCDCAQDMILSF